MATTLILRHSVELLKRVRVHIQVAPVRALSALRLLKGRSLRSEQRVPHQAGVHPLLPLGLLHLLERHRRLGLRVQVLHV